MYDGMNVGIEEDLLRPLVTTQDPLIALGIQLSCLLITLIALLIFGSVKWKCCIFIYLLISLDFIL